MAIFVFDVRWSYILVALLIVPITVLPNLHDACSAESDICHLDPSNCLTGRVLVSYSFCLSQIINLIRSLTLSDQNPSWQHYILLDLSCKAVFWAEKPTNRFFLTFVLRACICPKLNYVVKIAD